MRYHGTRNVFGQKENAVIKEIVKDEAILSQACEKATADDASVAQDLVETLVSLEDAAGLAANQIGETKAVVAYLDDDDNPHVMYNPVLKQGLAPFKAVEACLSREEEKKVTRFARIQVAYQELVDGELVERKRKFEGWTAQVIQHLIDHCKGKLI